MEGKKFNQICFTIGLFLLIPFKPRESAASVSEEDLRLAAEKRAAFYRDTKSSSFSVAGVTFSNENGKIRSRQTILRRILFNDPPFNTDHTVTLEKYFFDGEPAYYVKVNNFIIGNVPREFVPSVDFNADRPYKIDDFQVYGGQGNKNFGASLKIVYLDTLET